MKLLLLFLIFTLDAQVLAQSKPTTSQSLVFTRVTVIDATGSAAKSDMTVVITGGRISTMGKSRQVRFPKDAQVVDATGKFLIPGLWDMHVHWSLTEYLPLFIANGVTGVRMMRGVPMHHQWRKEMENGSLLGPRLAIASSIVDGPNPIHRGSISVSSEVEARQAVSKVKQEGADFIKVYSLIPRDAFFALADEAKKQHIPFAGHVPRSVTATEVSDSGQKSIEHLSGVVFASSSREADVQGELVELRKQLAGGANYLALLRRLEAKHVDTYDRQKAATLFARFKQNGTWHCPTFTALRGGAFLDDPNFTHDTRLKYLPPEMRAGWEPKNNRVFQNSTAADYAGLKKIFLKMLEMAGAMRTAGVEFLAGTDVANPYTFPGFSLHDELVLLVKSGLTPMEALQAATRNPARYLGLLDSLGTVEKGKIADLVLLEGNPLLEISNTQKIHAVVVGGKLIPKAKLEAMLAKVEATANKQ